MRDFVALLYSTIVLLVLMCMLAVSIREQWSMVTNAAIVICMVEFGMRTDLVSRKLLKFKKRK